MRAWLLGSTLSDGCGWNQKAKKTMIDNEANPSGIKREFRVWCVRHQNGEIEMFCVCAASTSFTR